MSKEELPKGFTCNCGKYHRFPLYVYAHWEDEIVLTCPECGKRWNIIYGRAEELESEE